MMKIPCWIFNHYKDMQLSIVFKRFAGNDISEWKYVFASLNTILYITS